MKSIIRSLVILIGMICNCAVAQVPLDYRTEQVYLAPRSLSCSPGESLLVDGIVTCLASDRTEPYSRYLYLELIGDNDSVYVRQKLSCADGGRFSTSIPIEHGLSSGVYYLRGYTRFMRSFSSSAFAIQPIAVGLDISDDGNVDSGETINCKVAANGGFLLNGIPQRVSAVVTNDCGYPLAGRNLTLVSNDGDTIGIKATSASGYASFDFVPNVDKLYTIVYCKDSVSRMFPLPEIRTDGVKIRSAISSKKLRFEIVGNSCPKGYRLFAFDRNNGILEIGNPELSGVVSLTNAPSGPVTLFLTDSVMQVLNENTILPLSRNSVSLKTNKEVISGSNLDYAIEGIDTKKNSVLARIVPDNSQWEIGAEEALVYSTDYSSVLPYPRRRGTQNMRYEELSAWYENARFDRFDFQTTVQNDTSTYEYFPEFVMGFIGSVFDDTKAKHIVRKGQVLAMDRESGYFYMTDILENGQFGVIVDDFDEGTTFSLHTLGYKGKNIETMIVVEDDTFPTVYLRPAVKLLYNTRKNFISTDSVRDGKFLPEVTVKARLKRDKKKQDKAHYEVKMKDREAIERRGYLTLLDILRDMPLITVEKVEKNNGGTGSKVWRIYSSRGASVLNQDEDRGLVLVIDGVKIDPDALDVFLETPASNIESVEQVSIGEALMMASNAFDGAISVKTRRLGPIKKEKSKGTILAPLGLSNIKLSNFKKMRAPDKPGNYRLLVDIVGPDGVVSLSNPIKVFPKR